MGFTKAEFGLSGIRSLLQASAKNAKDCNDQAQHDEYAANLAAQANVRSKPKYPVALPVPNGVPVNRFLKLTTKPPKPIKGTLQKRVSGMTLVIL